MKRNKRIALFAGQADESYQSRFISGFMKNAFAAGYDVCVFSMYLKYQDTPERELGESNIFSLMNPEKFDGAIILKDSIQTENAAEKLKSRSERALPEHLHRLLYRRFRAHNAPDRCPRL